MIKQQLEAWKDYYQNEFNDLELSIQKSQNEMLDIMNKTDIMIPDMDTFLISLSIEFNLYQNSHKIGSNLQQLIDYPMIYRYKLLKSEVSKAWGHVETLESKVKYYDDRINNYEHNDFCEPCPPDGSLTRGMSFNHVRTEYTRNFERLGETEKYCWYTEEMRKTLSISFSVLVECNTCHEYFDINIWKHYPLISETTDIKTEKIYEISTNTENDHDFPEEFFGKLLNRKQALFKFLEVLNGKKYRVIHIENTC